MKHTEKIHDPHVLTLNPRQLSIVIAGVVVLGFFVFIAGYFYGQKNAAEHFTYRLDQESLADQIYSSVCGLYDNHTDADGAEEAESSEKPEAPEEVKESPSTEEAPGVVAQPVPVAVQKTPEKQYYAQLVGFNTEPAAQKCLDRLKKSGYRVTLEKRSSTSKGGAKVAWYQVVTVPYSDKRALVEVVEKIKKAEKINQVRILSA